MIGIALIVLGVAWLLGYEIAAEDEFEYVILAALFIGSDIAGAIRSRR